MHDRCISIGTAINLMFLLSEQDKCVTLSMNTDWYVIIITESRQSTDCTVLDIVNQSIITGHDVITCDWVNRSTATPIYSYIMLNDCWLRHWGSKRGRQTFHTKESNTNHNDLEVFVKLFLLPLNTVRVRGCDR